jgi:hypothetical protein
MEMATKPKVEEIIEALHYERCVKAVDIAINTLLNPVMYEITWDDEIRGVKFTVKAYETLDNATLYISKDPKLKVLITPSGCYYTED